MNGKLKSLFDLIVLYAETNSQIVESWKKSKSNSVMGQGWNAEFTELTNIMMGLKDVYFGL